MGTGPKNIDTILSEAVEIESATDRSAFLDEACGGDSQLRQRLDKLVSDHFRAGSVFLEQPPAAFCATLDQPITEKPGTQIGPYKLLQQIGEGGMGVVYMAEQKEPVKRRVALKIIKPGMDTRQVIARFEAERQALAMMDHPNIAKVLDAGQTESGRPYFVMELVNGISVTKYCDEQHLNPKERLNLFVHICQAVQHAHQKGIIHRDLKPSNVLVALYDGKAVPKVIDFGVAKATNQSLTDKTMFTQLGQIVGTLEYMSPEQAQRNQLDVDTRSDVYSLGVILYELLSGETPFDSKKLRSVALEEMLRMIREDEPSKPSTKLSSSQALPSIAANRRIDPQKLGATIRGELDWIVMKALEKDRARRYETASKFAEDVQHYLNDEAVLACPPSTRYRLRKFVRKHRARLITAGLLSAALLVAVGGVGWAVRDRAAHRAAVVLQTKKRQERTTAQVELLLTDVDRQSQEQRWDEALATARRAEVALASGEADATVTANVRIALRELEFVARLDEVRMETVVWIENGFDNAGAAQSYEQAFQGFGVDLASSPTAVAQLKRHPRITLPVVAALDALVAARRESGGAMDGDQDWSVLVDTARGLDPDPLRNQLRAVWGREVTPELRASLRDLVETFEAQAQGRQTANSLAATLGRAGLHDLQEQVLRMAQHHFPADYWLNFGLAQILHSRDEVAEEIRFLSAALAAKPDNTAALLNLGNALGQQGKPNEAIACYRRAIELDRNFMYGHLNLGNALQREDKLEEAVACYRRAIELTPSNAAAYSGLGKALADQGNHEEAIAWHRKAIQLEPNEAVFHCNLGVAFWRQGRLDEAIACYRTSIELDPNPAYTHDNLGVALLVQGKLDLAIACLRKAINADPSHVDAHIHLAAALLDQKNLDEAIACYKRAIELDPGSADAHNGLGLAFAHQGKVDEAMAYFRKAIELEPSHADAHYCLGIALRKQKQPDAAIACFRKAIGADPSYSDAYNNLGVVLAAQGQPDEAIACYEKAIELDPSGADAHNNLGVALAERGKLDEAITCYEKAIELDPSYANAHNNLGIALRKQKKTDEAITCYEKAIELDPSGANAHYNLGIALHEQKKLEEAIVSYKRAIELAPDSATCHIGLGAALRDQNQLQEATSCYRKAAELDPKNPEPYRRLGNVLRKRGDINAAIDAYSTCIELSPAGSGPHNNYGLALLEVGRTAEAAVAFADAVKFFDRLAKEEPGDRTHRGNLLLSLVNLAKTQLALKNEQAHEEACESLVALFPPTADRQAAHWGHLGQLLYRAGAYRKARDSLQKAISLRAETQPPAQGGPRWWYLALAEAKLGEKDKSLEIYQQLVQQSSNNEKLPPSVEKLRLEAAKLLGLE